MHRRWVIRIAAFALLYYVALVLLDNVTYLLVHIPTPVVKLDPVIIALSYVQQALTLPRWVLRQLWWGESTPTLLNWALTLANCLIWGALLTWLTRNRWRNSWDNAV